LIYLKKEIIQKIFSHLIHFCKYHIPSDAVDFYTVYFAIKIAVISIRMYNNV